MTSQQHADHLLAIYQQRRSLPSHLRLVSADFIALHRQATDEYEAQLAAVTREMSALSSSAGAVKDGESVRVPSAYGQTGGQSS